MHIVVLIKQVPATDNVKIDPERGTMVRNNVKSELNPLDLYAVEEAVRIKERLNGEARIDVLSMGPSKAVATVKNAIARGCDRGILLSDKKFAGADTWSTAYTLFKAVQKHLSPFDLILCGERATDGDTGQVGPMMAAFLNLPVLTFVREMPEVSTLKVVARRAVEGGQETVEVTPPLVVSVVKAINNPRLPNLAGKRMAKAAAIPVLKAMDIEADESRLGLKGSPTRVIKVQRPQVTRKGRMLKAEENIESVAAEVLEFISPARNGRTS